MKILTLYPLLRDKQVMSHCLAICAHDSCVTMERIESHVHISWDNVSHVHMTHSCARDSFMCTWVMCTYRETTWQNDSCILYRTHVVSRYVHTTRVTKILYVTWLILYVTWLILNMTCLVCHDGADRVSCAQFARQRESYAHDWVMCTWLMCTYRETTWRHSFVTMERIKSHVHMLRDNVSHVHMTESCAHESCAHIARQRDSWDMKTSARNMFIMSLNESF